MKELTLRQRQIIVFIDSFIKSNGYSPTFNEIADRFEMASASGARKHIKALEKKGFVINSGFFRGITIKA